MPKENATIVIEKITGFEATHLTGYFIQPWTQRGIDIMCNSPNLGYHFEIRFDHFLFYKDNFGYGNSGEQYHNQELMGIKELCLGEDSAKKECLELLLGDEDILYKTVFLKSKNSSQMIEVISPHVGWAD